MVSAADTGKTRSDELTHLLRVCAPGTELRAALDLVISGKTGALIVIGNSEKVKPICDGGFEVRSPLTANRLAELAKTDGAIILDDDAQSILRFNVQLVPDPSLPTLETGTRHRTAERVSRQTDALVVSISQSRDIISLYHHGEKHVLEDIRVILAKANQALSTLERYKIRLDEVAAHLSVLEFEDSVTLLDVSTVITRSEMVERIAREIDRYIVELGAEGRLIQMQLDELMAGVAENHLLLIRDYTVGRRSPETARREISRLSADELIDPVRIVSILAYKGELATLETPVRPRGYRMLRKIPRLPLSVIGNIVSRFGDLSSVVEASAEALDDVEGVGEVRARAIRDGLQRLREFGPV